MGLAFAPSCSSAANASCVIGSRAKVVAPSASGAQHAREDTRNHSSREWCDIARRKRHRGFGDFVEGRVVLKTDDDGQAFAAERAKGFEFLWLQREACGDHGDLCDGVRVVDPFS